MRVATLKTLEAEIAKSSAANKNLSRRRREADAEVKRLKAQNLALWAEVEKLKTELHARPQSMEGRDWSAVPLGKKPDPTIARELGCPRQTVTDARRRRGIPAFKKEKAT